jgi:Excalibur calcium-binding domain
MQHRESPSEFKPSRRAVTILVTLLFIAAGAFAYYCYQLVQRQRVGQQREFVASEPATPLPTTPAQYRCDGRTRCSEMTSCDEAKFFLRTCPGTQMDGDSDGIPCEQQWCGN